MTKNKVISEICLVLLGPTCKYLFSTGTFFLQKYTEKNLKIIFTFIDHIILLFKCR